MKQLVVLGGLSLLGLVVSVPVVAQLIRQIEPGRDPAPDQQNLANRHIAIPETGAYVLAHCTGLCRLGTWVKIYTGRLGRSGVLAVWAESGDDRIWYYPSDAGFFPAVNANAGSAVLSDGFKLSLAHKAQRHWRLRLQVIDAPAPRSDIPALGKDHIVAASTLQIDLGSD